MSDSPYFTIIIPVFNVEQYVEECIASVLRQTFSNYEVIIVDDGSQDKSIEVARAVIGDDPRFNIVTQQNGGLSSARNAGLRVAKGDYIYFLDADDYISIDSLHNVYETARNYEFPELIAFGAKTFISGQVDNDSSLVMMYDKYYARDYIPRGRLSGSEFYALMRSNNNFVSSACLYFVRRNVYTMHHLKFKTGIIYEDELFTRLLLASVRSVFYMAKRQYHRRLRNESITQTKLASRNIVSWLQVADELMFQSSKLKSAMLKRDAFDFYQKSIVGIGVIEGSKPLKGVRSLCIALASSFGAFRRLAVASRFFRRCIFSRYYDKP